MNEAISGLGALGFWLFLAILVVAIVWAIVRKAQIRQDALIRIVESGQKLDKEIIEKIFSVTPRKDYQAYDFLRGGSAGAGVTFFIGFFTVFAGFIWEGGISYPIVGLGIFAILYSMLSLYQIEKKFRELEKNKLKDLE
jgi:hypothetical protein